MSSFLALVALALIVAPFVVLARRPGWDQVRPTHPDAARLAAERDAVESRRGDQSHRADELRRADDQPEPAQPRWRPAA